MHSFQFSHCLLAFIITMLIIPVLIHISHKNKWYDIIDQRKIHNGNIPRLGGIGIFLSFIFSIAVFSIMNPAYRLNVFNKNFIVFLIGGLIIHIVGLLDDFNNLRARYKAFIESLVAIGLVFLDIRIDHIQVPFTEIVIYNKYILSLLSFLWYLGIFNAINLIDGIDGLSSVVSGIVCLGYTLHFFYSHHVFMASISITLFFAISGFFFYNKPKAKIFMGDSGSLFLGYALSVLPFLDVTSFTTKPVLATVITILLIPISDTLFAMARRTYRRIKISVPDKEHLHHMLLDFDFTNWEILILMTFINTLLIVSTIVFKDALFIIWILFFISMNVIHLLWKKRK